MTRAAPFACWERLPALPVLVHRGTVALRTSAAADAVRRLGHGWIGLHQAFDRPIGRTLAQRQRVRWPLPAFGLVRDGSRLGYNVRIASSAAMSDAAALSHLINAYFHQDWTFEGSTATEVLAVFRRENGEPTVAAAARAAQDLVTRELTEDALMETLAGLGLQYDPSYEHMTYHQWLALVAEMS